jgi:hypothetical protein
MLDNVFAKRADGHLDACEYPCRGLYSANQMTDIRIVILWLITNTGFVSI